MQFAAPFPYLDYAYASGDVGPESRQEQPRAEMDVATARSPTLEAIVHIFEDALDCDAINPEQNFFTQGGNSLHAVRALSLINAEYRLSLTLSDILEAPTAFSLTALVLRSLAESATHQEMEVGTI